jgi:hypothetical protein
VTLLPDTTPAELEQLREVAETARLDVEAALFLFPETFTDLDFQFTLERAATARARYEAVLSQRPDRTPFAGRTR